MTIKQLFAAYFVSQSLSLAPSAASLPHVSNSPAAIRPEKRADPTWHSSCDGYPEIRDAWGRALHMAQHTIDVLSSNDPFSDQNAVNQSPFDLWWEPARLNLFGQNSLTSHDQMLDFYHQIANGPPVTVACSDPPNGKDPSFSRCDLYDQDTWMYRLNLDPNGDGYADDRSVGFADGNNLVICPKALPGGTVKSLVDQKPQAGDPIATYRYTYEFQLVHELAHVVGAAFDHKYGMPDCTQLARDAASGTSSQRPADNADSWALFALAVSDVSSPPMSDFDWTGGSTGGNSRHYTQE
ncbi:hypothetical protein P171DRAFT_516748 [Karstenula rhodostoma CBS 690.94]|uniref:Uncharacterized protein n=1 Tax=Karstenula rhodostoma CBS 690.94 TaxID=1392251 RepID=A0A9P4PVI7_9PLEO|nr:hypothetical protein P171DRAFT_516748 [Karstenula rhodostoma CBS 690.94]